MIEFLKFAVPVFVAVLAWFFNEWRKRYWEQYQRKEQNYKELIRCIDGFCSSTINEDENVASNLRKEFLRQFYLCWLYCPDDVIQKGNELLVSIRDGNPEDYQHRDKLAGNFILSIRKDILPRRRAIKTKLTSDDFKMFATKPCPHKKNSNKVL